MRAQARDGHELTYFFSGRRYPLMRRPRIHRWRSGDLEMVELLASPINSHWEVGTRFPERDIEEPQGQRAFARTLERSRPDIVHIHELTGLPSSIIDLAVDRGIPVVMTLHDYAPICASVRLVDADGQRCTRARVADVCARNCRWAPEGYHHIIDKSVRFELTRMKEAIPGIRTIDFHRVEPIVRRVTDRSLPTADRRGDALAAELPEPSYPAAALYQQRRERNIERLRRCSRLIAPSRRVAEIYAALGADPERMVVQRLTLPHIETLRPRPRSEAAAPLTFVTLGGCAHPTKGSRVLADALDALVATGYADRFRLLVIGAVDVTVYERMRQVPGVAFGPARYDPEDVDRLLDTCDIGLMPSYWEEPHGFVGVEMLAKGLPVIGNATGGITDYVIDGRTGWLNPGGDGAGLAAIMSRLIDAPAEVAALTESVRALRDDLVVPMAAHVAEVDELYREVVAARDLAHSAR